MTSSDQAKDEYAASAGPEQIPALLHDPSPQVISALLANRNLTEDDVLIIASRKNLRPELLTAIYRDQRWAESYPVRLALASNPKTPLSVSLTISRHIRLFDLAKLTTSPYLPLVFRNKIEAIIMERIPTMALGLKKSLAKRAVGNVLLKLMQTQDDEVIALCLNNPRLLESHLYKIIGRKDTSAKTIMLIAGHPNWSLRPSVRFALVRSEHTPLLLTERFLHTIPLPNLRDLYDDPSLPASTRPLVHREILARGRHPEDTVAEEVIEIDETDESALAEYEEYELNGEESGDNFDTEGKPAPRQEE